MPFFVLGLRSSQLAAMWKKQPAGRENHCPSLQQPHTSEFISHTLLRCRRSLPVGQGPGRMALALGGPTHASRRRMKAQWQQASYGVPAARGVERKDEEARRLAPVELEGRAAREEQAGPDGEDQRRLHDQVIAWRMRTRKSGLIQAILRTSA